MFVPAGFNAANQYLWPARSALMRVMRALVWAVSVRMPTPDERRRLHLGAGVPVMIVLRTAYDTTGRPVEVTDTVKAGPSYVLEYRVPAQ